jgi:hypothetical protein
MCNKNPITDLTYRVIAGGTHASNGQEKAAHPTIERV